MTKNKLLLLLVLLVAVVSGAWAADGIECSASDIGKVICTDGSIYAKVSDVPTGKTAAAMIAYIDMENKNGLALALSNEGSMKWSDAITACEGKSAVAGGTWVLPSKEQWEAMGAVNSTSATALRDGFSSVGGTNMESGAYWSSTANDANDNKAWRYYFTAGYNWENNVNKTVENYVRACLTFNILVAPPTYSVTLAEGTEDATNWTVPEEAAEGASVTATYNGEKKVKSVKAVKKAAVDPMLATPLTIEAITPGNISVSGLREGFRYSKNGGAKTAVTNDEIVLNAGDKVQFYGDGTSITCYNGTIITGSGDGFTCKMYGNIMSLVDEEGFATATTLSEGNTFYGLFFGFNTLTDASALLLPATQLAASCYYYMFRDCSNLTAAPALPAETLAESCYNQMFRGCTSLTTAPALPAETLVSNCYRSMFMGCSALTAAPVLPATQLTDGCYYQMFTNCSKLATVTCLATSGINTGSSYNWLSGAGSQVQGTKTFNAVSTAVWLEGNSGIPDGWTRVNVDN